MARPSGASALEAPSVRTVVLVRHGATAPEDVRGSPRGSVPGPSLTTHGRTQAARAADAVFRIGTALWPDLPRAGALVASPTASTLQTAAAVGRRIGHHVRTDERLAARGEAYAQVGARSWEALVDIVTAAAAASTTVVVTHEVTIRALVGRALDAPPATWPRLRVPPCSLTILRLDADADADADAGVPALAEVTAVGVPTDV